MLIGNNNRNSNFNYTVFEPKKTNTVLLNWLNLAFTLFWVFVSECSGRKKDFGDANIVYFTICVQC